MRLHHRRSDKDLVLTVHDKLYHSNQDGSGQVL